VVHQLEDKFIPSKVGGRLMFIIIVGDKEIPPGYEINKRTAVRAVLHYQDQVLMVKTNLGDYKFPGGGVNPGEEQEKALIREIQEETGYGSVQIGNKLGVVIQQHPDHADPTKYFRMESVYYQGELIDLTNKGLKLDAYEEEQGFHGEFITLSEALTTNLRILNEDRMDKNDWVEREVKVLKFLLHQE
jgi:ADP-ribose pyrophosphatase YjhB (NUDIX family)